jgi:hypothetical protein
MMMNFTDEYVFHTSQGSLTCRKILQHGADSFTSPPKGVKLRIFIARKNIFLGWI